MKRVVKGMPENFYIQFKLTIRQSSSASMAIRLDLKRLKKDVGLLISQNAATL